MVFLLTIFFLFLLTIFFLTLLTSTVFTALLFYERYIIQGFLDNFKDAQTGPHVTQTVQTLCELIAAEKAPELVVRIDEWMRAKKGRRLVDFRFNSDSKLCAGGVLSV